MTEPNKLAFLREVTAGEPVKTTLPSLIPTSEPLAQLKLNPEKLTLLTSEG